MKQLLVYYKLILLDSVVCLITVILGAMLVFKNITASNMSEIIILGFILPLFMSLLFTILDLAFISNCVNLDDIYSSEFPKTTRRKRLTKAQRLILKNLNVYSSLIIVTSIIIIFFMNSKSIIDGIILYELILVLGICHSFITNKYRINWKQTDK